MTTISSQNPSFRFFATKRIVNRQAVLARPRPESRRCQKFLKPKINLRRSTWVTPPVPPNNITKVFTSVTTTIHAASHSLRRIFENRRLKTAVGANLAILTMLTGLVRVHSSLAVLAFLPTVQPETTINQPKIDIVTKKSPIMPVANFQITQGFSFFHPGIDLAVDIGTPVHPVMAGKVTESGWSIFGYGYTIVIDHQNSYSTRYAHLSKILVNRGEKVETDNIIGLSGSTGRSSGPHLHLEVTDHGIPINPKSLLE